jgi:hypothetical protein
MWAKVAEEMAIPWRAAEAMHWQLGEQEMARRAGVVPFSLSSGGGSVEPPTKVRRSNTVMPRLRRQSVSVAPVSQRAVPPPIVPPPQQQPPPQALPQVLSQAHAPPAGGQPQLPSLEELTAGVPAYASPLTQPMMDPYRMARPQPPPPPPLNLRPPGDMSGIEPPVPRTRA